MSIAPRRAPAKTFTPAPAGKRLAPWGWYTRYMLRGYVRHTFIMIAALLSIALTTDLSTWIWRLFTSNPDAGWLWLTFRIGRIVVLRGTDLLALTTPISCFLGVLWSEAMHTWSRERLTIWNLGRSPIQCTVPVVLFAAIMGLLQFSLDVYLRPAAVMALENRPDEQSPDFNFSSDKHWIAAGDDLVHTRISPGPPPGFAEVTIYRLGNDGALTAAIVAEKATPGSAKATWILRNGRIWTTTPQTAQPDPNPPAPDRNAASERAFEQMDVILPIDPLWVTRYGIHPQYLPHSALRELTTVSGGSHSAVKYRVWYEVRYANAFMPGALALLATSLSLLLIPYRIRPGAVFVIAFAGYAAHVFEKVCLVLGEYDKLSPAVAAWIVPLTLVMISTILLIILVMRTSYVTSARPRSGGRTVAATAR